jgi:murein DD-endopeptidase MepM/ murein hydrolase activator NlpD
VFVGNKSTLSILARCAMFAAGVLLLTGKASAEEEPIGSRDLARSSDTSAPQLTENGPRARISIGPQWVQPGEARYAQRSTVGGNATEVVFSRSPAPALARGGALLPAGLPVWARLTGRFGMRAHPISGGMRAHSGVDLAAPYGSPIVATADGVIGTAGWSGGYGLLVAISHGGGVQTRYGHLSRLNVAAGQQVRRGDVIGFVGSTGESTGPHVHYEVRVNGVATDPLGG